MWDFTELFFLLFCIFIQFHSKKWEKKANLGFLSGGDKMA